MCFMMRVVCVPVPLESTVQALRAIMDHGVLYDWATDGWAPVRDVSFLLSVSGEAAESAATTRLSRHCSVLQAAPPSPPEVASVIKSHILNVLDRVLVASSSATASLVDVVEHSDEHGVTSSLLKTHLSAAMKVISASKAFTDTKFSVLTQRFKSRQPSNDDDDGSSSDSSSSSEPPAAISNIHTWSGGVVAVAARRDFGACCVLVAR